MISYSLKVTDIRKETEDTITLCFKQPGLKKVKYKPGQYLSLVFRINGRRYVRPYSFSSAPIIDSLIEITVKRVSNGMVSNHIHDQVKIGDVIEAIEPMGDFLFQHEEGIKDLFFWGIGSGITPLISIIKSVLHSYNEIRINLIYGNRDFEKTIFSTVLDALLIAYPDRFHVWHFHTQYSLRADNLSVVEGRIDAEKALVLINQEQMENTRHFICGPTGLKESVKEALAKADVPVNHIFSEDFELIKDPKDFENITTENVSLKFQDHEYDLEVVKGQSILDAALDSGLELPYSCQTGNCSTCKATLTAGKVVMIGLTKDRDDLKQDEYLLCCSHPNSNNVYLEI